MQGLKKVLNHKTITKGDLENKIILPENENSNYLFYYKEVEHLHLIAEKNSVSKIVVCSKLNVDIVLNENANVIFYFVDLTAGTTTFKAHLLGENAQVHVNTLVISKEKIQINQEIIHKAKHTFSEIKNYGVSLEKGSISFETVGKIENKNSSSNCRQLSKGLILGDEGYISSKPILLIDEFDVKAYHGASIGKMNEDDLFYLMSRGLTKEESYRLVLLGMTEPFLNEIKNQDIKEMMMTKINQNL